MGAFARAHRLPLSCLLRGEVEQLVKLGPDGRSLRQGLGRRDVQVSLDVRNPAPRGGRYLRPNRRGNRLGGCFRGTRRCLRGHRSRRVRECFRRFLRRGNARSHLLGAGLSLFRRGEGRRGRRERARHSCVDHGFSRIAEQRYAGIGPEIIQVHGGPQHTNRADAGFGQVSELAHFGRPWRIAARAMAWTARPLARPA
jgi:hypothetical protein